MEFHYKLYDHGSNIIFYGRLIIWIHFDKGKKAWNMVMM